MFKISIHNGVWSIQAHITDTVVRTVHLSDTSAILINLLYSNSFVCQFVHRLHTEITTKYNIKCNFLDIQIWQSIPSVWRDVLYNSSKQKSRATDIIYWLQNVHFIHKGYIMYLLKNVVIQHV